MIKEYENIIFNSSPTELIVADVIPLGIDWEEHNKYIEGKRELMKLRNAPIQRKELKRFPVIIQEMPVSSAPKRKEFKMPTFVKQEMPQSKAPRPRNMSGT